MGMENASPLVTPRFDNAVAMFWDAVDKAPSKLALIEGTRRINYDEFGRAVAALSHHLSQCGAAGECVALVIPNSIECNIAVFAALASGAQVTLLNAAYTEAELARLFAASAPRALIVLAGTAKNAQSAAARAGIDSVICLGKGEFALEALISSDARRPDAALVADEFATLGFTGGTTGVPKGVERTHRMLMNTIAGMDEAWPARVGEDVWLNVAPVSHVWGFFMGCMNPVYNRSTLVVVPRFTPDNVVSEIARHKVTFFSGGPAAIYGGLLSSSLIQDADLSALRICPGGGSPFLMELLSAWEKRTGVPILEAYGMTEAGPITANPADGAHRIGTTGLPLTGIELEIVSIDDPDKLLAPNEVGEVRIRGARVVHRYRGESAGHPEGWLYTGDVGCVDEDGFLQIIDRKKDMLIVSGYNVYPREIEELLLTHPEVKNAAVIGVADERKGEVPIAFVETAEEGERVAIGLEQFVEANLAGYKQPQHIIPVDAIPQTVARKNDRKRLAEMAKEYINE